MPPLAHLASPAVTATLRRFLLRRAAMLVARLALGLTATPALGMPLVP